MITNHQLISSSDFRKHHDSPFLWIFVSTGSLCLHLSVFWLIQSSTNFQFSLFNSQKNIIPVDIIDISTLTISENSRKSSISKNINKSPEKLVPKSPKKQFNSSVNVPKKPLENYDKTITSNITSSSENKTQPQKSKVKQTPTNQPENNQPQKSEVKQTPTNQPQNNHSQKKTLPIRQQSYPALTNRSKPKTKISENEKPWNRHQDIKLGKEKPLPQDIKPESSSTDKEQDKQDRGEAIATVTPLIKDEVNELIQQKKLLVDALPDILPEYKGSQTKDIDISLLPDNVTLKPANIFASLIIDKNGNFQQSIIISIEPKNLSSDKSIYEKALNLIFQQSNFTAGYNQDGSKPELSNLYVRLKIELTDQTTNLQ